MIYLKTNGVLNEVKSVYVPPKAIPSSFGVFEYSIKTIVSFGAGEEVVSRTW